MNRLSGQQLNKLASHAVSRFPDDPFGDDVCEVLLLRAACEMAVQREMHCTCQRPSESASS